MPHSFHGYTWEAEASPKHRLAGKPAGSTGFDRVFVYEGASEKQKKFTMKITLELPPDVEARLRESAARYDADTVRRLLVEAFTPTVDALLRELPDALTDTAFEAVADQLADELTACRRPNAPVLSDHAVSRAGIYEDHP